MRLRSKALSSLKSKLLKPCTKLVPIFRLNRKKPVYIRAPRPKNDKSILRRKRQKGMFRGLFPSRRKATRGMDRLAKLESFSGRDNVFRPEEADGRCVDDVEDSCRSFENYLAEMIVDERKLKDLTDVEELLYCWKSLNCPVFIDLVTRFYGELCKDLFSPEASST